MIFPSKKYYLLFIFMIFCPSKFIYADLLTELDNSNRLPKSFQVSSEIQFRTGRSYITLNGLPYRNEQRKMQSIYSDFDYMANNHLLLGIGLKFDSITIDKLFRKHSSRDGEQAYFGHSGFEEPSLHGTYYLDSYNNFSLSHKLNIGTKLESGDQTQGNNLQGGASTKLDYNHNGIINTDWLNSVGWMSVIYFEYFHSRTFSKGIDIETYQIVGGHTLGVEFELEKTLDPWGLEFRLILPLKWFENYKNKYNSYDSSLMLNSEYHLLLKYLIEQNKLIYLRFLVVDHTQSEFTASGFNFTRENYVDIGYFSAGFKYLF